MNVLLCLCSFLSSRFTYGIEPNVFFVTDDTPSGHKLGRITHPSGGRSHLLASNTGWKCVIVRSSRPPAAYFSVEEKKCDLYTKTTMDRESLCGSKVLPQRYGSTDNLHQALYSASHSKYWAETGSTNECEFTFQVSLHRYSGTKLTVSSLPEFLDIRVVVVDRNDHVPSFQPHRFFNVSIPEAAPIGTRISLPLAYDPDSPEFTIKRYQLYPQDVTEWALYQQTEDVIFHGNLYHEVVGLFLELRTNLDRERKESYYVDVRAFDSQQEITAVSSDDGNLLRIHVTVEDVNDNGPVFKPALEDGATGYRDESLGNLGTNELVTYKADVVETTRLKSPILRLRAHDPDSPVYASVRYEFAPYVDTSVRHLFKLNEHTGDLYLRDTLDYETTSSVSFHVVAIDSEHERRWKNEGVRSDPITNVLHADIYTATAQVIVRVQDINDEAPVIEVDYLRVDKTTGRPSGFAEVEENLEPPQFIADLLVTDRDANSANNYVTCTAHPEEIKPILAYGRDMNQTGEIYFRLTEVRRQPGRVQYNLLTVQSLDREKVPFDSSLLKIRVSCLDSGTPAKTGGTLISIHVADVNDNAPIIELPQSIGGSLTSQDEQITNNTVVLRENSPTGTVVARVNVTDRDPGVNGKITCSLNQNSNDANPAFAEYFHIDPSSCEIVTRKSIDRESSDLPIHKIILPIQAVDQGSPAKTAQSELHVLILDENDNPPTLPQTYYRLSVKENSPPGTSVGRLEIVDLDETNDEITVRFQKNAHLPFQLWQDKSSTIVHASTNTHSSRVPVIFHINTTKPLDREDKDSYEFKVLVMDKSDSYHKNAHTTTATVFVSVEDENDNDPIVIFPQQANKTFFLSNIERKHYQLMTVNANDKDSSNVQFTFSLLQEFSLGNAQKNAQTLPEDFNASGLKMGPPTFLEIDPNLGTVFLTRDMTVNDSGLYAFHVLVKDTDTIPRLASLRFLVKVERTQPRASRLNPLTDNRSQTHAKFDSRSSELASAVNKDNGVDPIYPSVYNQDITEFSGTRSESRRSLQRPPLLRLTGDMVLVLSLGMILLLLLATVCLVLYARRWNATVARSAPISQPMRGYHWLFPSLISRQAGQRNACKTTKGKVEPSAGHSSPIFWVPNPEQLDSSAQSFLESDKAEALNSRDQFLDDLDEAVISQISRGDQVFYRDCKKCSIMPITNSCALQVPRASMENDYTPLQSLTRFQTIPAPERRRVLQQVPSTFGRHIPPCSNDSLGADAKYYTPLVKGSKSPVFTSALPRPTTQTEKSQVKSFNNIGKLDSGSTTGFVLDSQGKATGLYVEGKQGYETEEHDLC